MNFQNIWNKITNDAHIPIALGVFVSTSAFHFIKHIDLGPNYTNSIYAMYGFLAAHGAAQQKWPDSSSTQGPTTGGTGS